MAKIQTPDGKVVGEIIPESEAKRRDNNLTILFLMILAGIGYIFRSVFKFIIKHDYIIGIIYLVIVTLIAIYAYYKSPTKFKFLGVIASICNFAPLYIYFRAVILWLLEFDSMLELVFYIFWMVIPSSIVILIVLGVAWVGAKTENGLWHFIAALPLLVISIIALF